MMLMLMMGETVSSVGPSAPRSLNILCYTTNEQRISPETPLLPVCTATTCVQLF
jgi:hypothetical protein